MNKQPSTAAIAAASAFARKDISNYSEFFSSEISDDTIKSLVTGALAAAYAVDFPMANAPGNTATVNRQAGLHPLSPNPPIQVAEAEEDEGFDPDDQIG